MLAGAVRETYLLHDPDEGRKAGFYPTPVVRTRCELSPAPLGTRRDNILFEWVPHVVSRRGDRKREFAAMQLCLLWVLVV
jgi:hypothetical protein